MRAWWRHLLIVPALLLLGFAGVAWWLVQGFDSERVKRIASDWMLTHQDRTLVFDGPVRLQLWPQPAVAVQRVRLSERGRPDKNFATIDSAALSLHLQPLLLRREVQVESVSARGVALRFTRDDAGLRNVDDLLDRVAGGEPRSGQPLAIDSLELADVALTIDDASAGVKGTLSMQQFSLGAFGPGMRTPLRMKAQAAKEAQLAEQKLRQLADARTRTAASANSAQYGAAGSPPAGQGGDANDLRSKYAEAIKTAVTAQWTRPDSVPLGTRCKVAIKQLPGGEVISAEVQPGCPMDQAGQDSLERAVLKAQPLPYRGFESVFERQLTLNFTAQDR